MKDEKIDLGAVRIHGKVIASIATIATLEVEGVKDIPKGLKDNVFNLLNKKSSLSGIKVSIDSDNEVQIIIPVIVSYGVSIPDIAIKIQDNVRAAIDRMTNMSLKDINVDIQGIERG